MPVNTGSLGDTISFQDLQDFYGGTHPISLSEYYRGGAEVPSTAISGNNPYTGTTSFSGGGSGSGGEDGIAVTTTTTPGSTSFGSLTTSTPSNSGQFTISDWQNISYVRVTQGGRGNHIVSTPGRQLYSQQQDDLPTSTIYFTGPNFQSSDTTSRNTVPLSRVVNNTVSFSGFRDAEIGRRTRTTSPTTHAVAFTNNTGQVISVSAVSPGTAPTETVGRGDTFGGATGQSSNAWSFSYSYADAGSGSGTADSTDDDGITVDVMTTPGMTVPGTLSVQSVGTATTVGSWFRSGTGGNRDGFMVIDFDSNTAFARLHWTGGGGLTSAIRDGSTIVSSGTDGNVFARGPAWESGDRGLGLTAAQIEAASQVSANGQISLGYQGNSPSRQGSATGRGTRGASTTTPTTHDITFENNTGSNIILSSGSTGGERTINAGATATVADDAASSSWSYTYRYAPSSQPANTAIPTSGTTGLNQFNAPGNAAP